MHHQNRVILAVCWSLLITLSALPLLAQTPTVLDGSQFQANSYTTGGQEYPSVAVGLDGAFVVVWQSVGSDNGDSSNLSIQARRYASGGIPLGGEFLVNTYTTDGQAYPSVAIDAEGDFVVVWQSTGSDHGDSSYISIQGQRYASERNAPWWRIPSQQLHNRRPGEAVCGRGHRWRLRSRVAQRRLEQRRFLGQERPGAALCIEWQPTRK